eukprot:scaffold2196_cov234-Pinguiococcus_pyrenoidosus.AAC.1
MPSRSSSRRWAPLSSRGGTCGALATAGPELEKIWCEIWCKILCKDGCLKSRRRSRRSREKKGSLLLLIKRTPPGDGARVMYGRWEEALRQRRSCWRERKKSHSGLSDSSASRTSS